MPTVGRATLEKKNLLTSIFGSFSRKAWRVDSVSIPKTSRYSNSLLWKTLMRTQFRPIRQQKSTMGSVNGNSQEDGELHIVAPSHSQVLEPSQVFVDVFDTFRSDGGSIAYVKFYQTGTSLAKRQHICSVKETPHEHRSEQMNR